MKCNLVIAFLFFLLIEITACLNGGGYYASNGIFIWKKDPSGRYNAHNPLRIEEANKWIEIVKPIMRLRKIDLDKTSNKWDTYQVNDSGMFFGNHTELANYHSYKTFAAWFGTDSGVLRAVIHDFDNLGLNRFYREKKYFAFETQTYISYSAGYMYFLDTTLVKNAGDTLNLKNLPNLDNFREALSSRFLILDRFDNHWIEWREIN